MPDQDDRALYQALIARAAEAPAARRHKLLDAARELASLSGLDPLELPAGTASAPGRPTRHDLLTKAYVSLNPDMLNTREIAVAASTSIVVTKGMVNQFRNEARHHLPNAEPMRRWPYLMPVHPRTGQQYHELGTPETRRRGAHDLYVFFAFAWANLTYAGFLAENYPLSAPVPLIPERRISYYTTNAYTHGDADGWPCISGTMYLDLAKRFVHTRLHVRDYFDLPVMFSVEGARAARYTPHELFQQLDAIYAERHRDPPPKRYQITKPCRAYGEAIHATTIRTAEQRASVSAETALGPAAPLPTQPISFDVEALLAQYQALPKPGEPDHND